MQVFSVFGIAVVSTLLIGCTAFVPVKDMSTLGIQQKAEVENVRIYERSELPSLKYTIVGSVQGNSCKVSLFDPEPTITNSLEQAKYYAWELGANGITDIRYVNNGTSVMTNCWSKITCSATAIKVEER